MEKYLIYYNESETSKQYVETIYRTYESLDKDMGDAIEFPTKELALLVCDFLRKRSQKDYKVMLIKTTIEEEVE